VERDHRADTFTKLGLALISGFVSAGVGFLSCMICAQQKVAVQVPCFIVFTIGQMGLFPKTAEEHGIS
jgi:hypothetical protein